MLERLISEAIRDQAFWRRNYHPGDPLRSPLRIPRLQRPARTHRHPCSAFTRLRRFARRLSAYRAEGAAGAEGAREGSQGQGRAERARSPWIAQIKFCRPGGPTEQRHPFVCRPSGAGALSLKRSRGGALRAGPWLPYAAPSALRAHSPTRRAFGAPRSHRHPCSAFTRSPKLNFAGPEGRQKPRPDRLPRTVEDWKELTNGDRAGVEYVG